MEAQLKVAKRIKALKWHYAKAKPEEKEKLLIRINRNRATLARVTTSLLHVKSQIAHAKIAKIEAKLLKVQDPRRRAALEKLLKHS